jgi:hypothetical protein
VVPELSVVTGRSSATPAGAVGSPQPTETDSHIETDTMTKPGMGCVFICVRAPGEEGIVMTHDSRTDYIRYDRQNASDVKSLLVSGDP